MGPEEEPTPAPPQPAATTPPGPSRYADRALEQEATEVAHAANGTRNHTLNTAAFNLAQFIPDGHLTRAAIEDTLTAAARAAGLSDAEIRATLNSGINSGREHPRQIPDSHPTPTITLLQQQQVTPEPSNFQPGGPFILDVPDHTPAVWGHGTDILWAEGEALIIAAGNGAGKTTLAGQLVRGRLGLSTTVLELPITPGRKRVLYLAMDRPQQIARALRRHFTEKDRDTLDHQLRVWKGPPPADLAKHPETLLALVKAADADTVIVDSLKDAAIGLSDDETGAGWNRARQHAIAAGCEVLELHHNIKRNPNGGAPNSIADIYGSAWITAGVGSAILLVGAPGDPVVEMRHVKQPSDEVGPWNLIHDHDRGTTTIYEQVDMLDIVGRTGRTTALTAAMLLFETQKPSRSEKEKARRKLDRLVTSGHLIRIDGGAREGVAGGDASEYRIAAVTEVQT